MTPVFAVSTLGSLVALWAGLSGKGPGPTWLWIVIAYVSLAFGLLTLWWSERRKAVLAEKLLQGLRKRCTDVIRNFQDIGTAEDSPLSGKWLLGIDKRTQQMLLNREVLLSVFYDVQAIGRIKKLHTPTTLPQLNQSQTEPSLQNVVEAVRGIESAIRPPFPW
jgi:hypothetical protein